MLAHIAMHPKNPYAFILGFKFDLSKKDVGHTWNQLRHDWSPWQVQILADNVLPDGTTFPRRKGDRIYGWFEVTSTEVRAKELLDELRDSLFFSTFDPSLPELDDLRLFMENRSCRNMWLSEPRPKLVCYVQDPEEDLGLRNQSSAW